MRETSTHLMQVLTKMMMEEEGGEGREEGKEGGEEGEGGEEEEEEGKEELMWFMRCKR